MPKKLELIFSQEADVQCIDELDVERDIDFILWSMGLYNIRRYFHQRFWTGETRDAEYAQRVESLPRLESVAEHSWHVADIVVHLSLRFNWLNRSRCLELAIIHDKLEIITGDLNPIGRDGSGEKAHGFNPEYQAKKTESEKAALEVYLDQMVEPQRAFYKNLFIEYEQAKTDEARFVKSIDKLQTIFYILAKKGGNIEDKHLVFTHKYASKCLIFPDISQHFEKATGILIDKIAKHRGVNYATVREIIETKQPDLFEA